MRIGRRGIGSNSNRLRADKFRFEAWISVLEQHGYNLAEILSQLVERQLLDSLDPTLEPNTILTPKANTSKASLSYGTVEEIAGFVAYLVSPEAGYITGANLRIDGGFSTNTRRGGATTRKVLIAASRRVSPPIPPAVRAASNRAG